MQPPHRVVVSKLSSKSARKRPTSPNTPPLAPTTAVQGSSKLALNSAPVRQRTHAVPLHITHRTLHTAARPLLAPPTEASTHSSAVRSTPYLTSSCNDSAPKSSMLDSRCEKVRCSSMGASQRWGSARRSGAHRAPHWSRKGVPRAHGSPPKHHTPFVWGVDSTAHQPLWRWRAHASVVHATLVVIQATSAAGPITAPASRATHAAPCSVAMPAAPYCPTIAAKTMQQVAAKSTVKYGLWCFRGAGVNIAHTRSPE